MSSIPGLPPPRVIPLFINELSVPSGDAFRKAHLLSFTTSLEAIFQCRVVDSDVLNLIMTLISLTQQQQQETILRRQKMQEERIKRNKEKEKSFFVKKSREKSLLLLAQSEREMNEKGEGGGGEMEEVVRDDNLDEVLSEDIVEEEVEEKEDGQEEIGDELKEEIKEGHKKEDDHFDLKDGDDKNIEKKQKQLKGEDEEDEYEKVEKEKRELPPLSFSHQQLQINQEDLYGGEDSVTFHAVRLLCLLFDLNTPFSCRSYAAVKRLCDILNVKKSIETERQATARRRAQMLWGGADCCRWNVERPFCGEEQDKGQEDDAERIGNGAEAPACLVGAAATNEKEAVVDSHYNNINDSINVINNNVKVSRDSYNQDNNHDIYNNNNIIINNNVDSPNISHNENDKDEKQQHTIVTNVDQCLRSCPCPLKDSVCDSLSFSSFPLVFPCLHMDHLLLSPVTRSLVLNLWKLWDSAGIDLSLFTAYPDRLHLYVGNRVTSRYKVYRDFLVCPYRPPLQKRWGSALAVCHVKTNIPKKSEVMYRILVEGYNYGINAVIQSDVVGYTNRNWDELGCLQKYGWPENWDLGSCNDYAPGVAISQYFSSDGYVTVRLRAKSLFCVGFSVSAWLVFEGRGAGFPITGVVFHQDYDL